MNFLTNETWEICNPFLRAFHKPGTRIYPTVELALNVPLWHVDILPVADAEQSCWHRFILTGIDQVLTLIEERNIQQHRISFQSKLSEHAESQYKIQKVLKIIAATEPDGKRTHVVVCSNGNRFIQPDMGHRETDLKNASDVYNSEVSGDMISLSREFQNS